MKSLYRSRLLRLAEFLEKLPPERFDLGVFAERTSCGTVACAMGWCPTAFPKSGIKLVETGQSCASYMYEVRFPEGYNARGAEKFFGLNTTRGDVVKLFYYTGYEGFAPKPVDVAKKIRRFVKDPGSL